jgi:hypothetical protein
MLKIRLQGTKTDIEWFEQMLKADRRIQILEFSEPYANKGTNRYFRVYGEIEAVSDQKTE